MKKKLFLAAIITVAAITLVIATVLTTMAYLTASTAVSNTFSVGNIGIEMYESAVDVHGNIIDKSAPKNATGNTYHLVPDETYTKDPTVYVAPGGEPSYIFIKLRNQIEEIEEAHAATEDDDPPATMSQQMKSNGWHLIAETETGDIYVYAGKDTSSFVEKQIAIKVTPHATDKLPIDVFQEFTVEKNLSQEKLAKFGGSKVTLNAFAIQASNFTTEDSEGNKTYGLKNDVIDAWNGICTDISFEKEFLNYDGSEDTDGNPETTGADQAAPTPAPDPAE